MMGFSWLNIKEIKGRLVSPSLSVSPIPPPKYQFQIPSKPQASVTCPHRAGSRLSPEARPSPLTAEPRPAGRLPKEVALGGGASGSIPSAPEGQLVRLEDQVAEPPSSLSDAANAHF